MEMGMGTVTDVDNAHIVGGRIRRGVDIVPAILTKIILWKTI